MRRKAAGFVLGACAVLLALELLLRGAGLAVSAARAVGLRLSAPGRRRVICLGESTTLGASTQYPAELEKLLNAGGPRYAVFNLGVAGIDSAEIVRRLDGELDSYRPDVVVAMMGANDGGEPWAEELARARSRSTRLGRLLSLIWSGRLGASPAAGLRRERLLAGAATSLEESAWGALRARRAWEAAPLFRAARLAGAGDEARLGLAACALSRGDAAAARTLAAEPALPARWDASRLLELGERYENEQRQAEALRVFELGRAAYERREAAWAALEAGLRAAGDVASARNAAAAAAVTRAVSSRAAFERGRACRQFQPPARCLPDFRRAVALSDEPGAAGWEGRASLRAAMRASLGSFLMETGDGGRAETALRDALAVDPSNEEAAALLARALSASGRGEAAYEVLLRSARAAPADDRRWDRLAAFEQDRGRRDRAALLRERARRLRAAARDETVTQHSYALLARKLAARGIPLVCLAYPNGRADELRRWLAGLPGVYFADDERGFKEQIARGGLASVFTDLFGGTFGHCTPLGYRLLAANARDGVLQAEAGRGRADAVAAQASSLAR